ncbi:MAG: hypothetical protein QHH15_07855 [Candidatus Thermoplasmatota archaeon]|jgi:hypothetical protein|nr:hypothetical protein [Candidatus Thermoplasmatota archaeon]
MIIAFPVFINGTDYHSHFKTEFGGIAFIKKSGIVVKKYMK